MKKVLMISYNFPPIGGVGIIRTLKFAKYLPKFGWCPYVLTVKNRDLFYTDKGSDKIPDQVHVYRSRNLLNNLSIFEGGLRKLGITSKILIPDAYIGWINNSVRLGIKIINEENIDLIYVSCPPYSSAIIGARLKEITGIPFIIDFRDAWTLNPYTTNYLFNSLEKKNNQLEKEVIESADHIITATDGIKTDYVAKYPFTKSKITNILNGFDLEDIPSSVTTFNKFTIAYTGFFYGKQTPELLFAALGEIVKNNLIPKDKLEFRWAGRDAVFVHKLIEKYKIHPIVNYMGLISKKDADEILYRSHLLFFVIGNTDEVSQNSTLTGKIFPYLASGRQILAIIPDGSAKELIEKYSDNYIITSGNVDEIVDAILDSYNQWENDQKCYTMTRKTEQFREHFNCETLTKHLGGIFDNTVGGAIKL